MTTQRGTVNKFLSTSALTLGLIASASATANAMDANTTPTGEQIVAGSATMDRPDASTLNINQNTDRVVINWDSFNIGSNAKTEFFQPNSGSLAVNRVTGRNSDPTQILGTLKANGRVMVLDRNGVVFGAGSRVDVGGIVASTGDVNDAAVMRGDTKLELSNFGDASVVNNGTISVTGAGLAALVAPHVANNGVIEARLGKIALAAGGERATVDLYGDGLVEIAVGGAKGKALAENAGVLSGATVLITAHGAKEVVDTVINMSGVVQATSATVSGGKIILDGGNAGKVKVSGTIDASGAAGGGDIKVTGEDIEVTNTAFVTADATNTGNGGSIYFMGGNKAIYSGNFASRGGVNGGNGGFIELSAKNGLGYDGSVTTMAVNGLAGSFLLDPAVAIIHSGWLDPIGWAHLIIKAENLANDMHSNGTITVQATDRIEVGTDISFPGIGNGDINLATYDYNTWGVTGYTSIWIPFIGTVTVPTYGLINHSGNANPGNLVLDSATVNFNKNLIMGTGNLTVQHTHPVTGAVLSAPTVNLNAQLLGTDGVTTSLLDQSRISSTASLVNVLSPSARIQQGIYLTANGGTVDVKAGTYNQGDIQINKALTVLGAGNGQTIVNAQGFGSGFYITASDVTVDGFDVKTGVGSGVWIFGKGWDTAANKIGNITIGDNGTGRGGNSITGDFGSGIYLTQGNIDGVSIVGNRISGGYAAIASDSSYQGGGFLGLNVKENTISDVDHGMRLYHLMGNNTISNNVFSNIGYYNITTAVSDVSTNLRLYNNSFDGNAQRLIDNNNGFTINASGNWWGTNNETTIASKMRGSVDFTPFLMGGTDTSAARGFQGDFSDLFVTALGAQIGTVGRVQEGVDDVTVGGTVTVGDGTFNENVLVYKSMLLQSANGMDATTIAGVAGLGADSVIKITADDVTLGGAGHGFNVVGNSLGNGINVASADDVSVVGNKVGGSAGSAINVSGGENATVDGNIVLNAGANGIHLDQVNGATVIGNTVSNAAFSGIQALWGRDLDIGNNIVAKSGANGIALMAVDGVNTVNDNTIDGTGVDGIYANNVSDLTVDGNNIGTLGGAQNIKGHGIYVYASNGAKILSNTVKNIAQDGVRITGGANVEVKGGRVSNVGGDGVHVERSAGVSITNLKIFKTGGDGIDVRNSAGAKIANNFIGQNGAGVAQGSGNIKGDGVYVEGSHGASITGNKITETASTSFDVGSGIHSKNNNNVVISGNTLSNIDWDGIKITGGTDVDVKGNTLSNVTRVAIYGAGFSGLTISGHNVINNAGNGLSGYGAISTDGGTNLTVTGNEIDGNAGSGVKINGAGGVNRVAGNVINNVVENGVEAVSVSNLTVSNNRIGTLGLAGNIGGNGIKVDNSSGALIRKNILNHAATGILVSGSDFSDIKGNEVLSVGNGIVLNNADFALIARNVVGLFTGDGVSVLNGSDNAEIRRNAVCLGLGDGVVVADSADASMHHNLIGALAGNGVKLDGADRSVVDRNLILLTGRNGVLVRGGADNTITNNMIGLAGRDGVRVNNANGLTTIHGNLIGLVADDGIDVNRSDNVDIRRNQIEFVGGNGVELNNNGRVRVVNNDIGQWGFIGNNGIEAVGNRNVRIARNDISNAANNGIMIDDNNRVRIVSNLITNSGNAGLYAAGADNGVVILEDNVFTGNPIGAWFESGIIDLTGATNTFNGGDIGMRFAPVGNPNDLTLVGNTIGTTTFNGQSQYYIELANAAFFAPGLPTILNGLNASYDGFVPNSVGGILTKTQFDAIESKIYHFNDDGSLGLFFFGAVPGIDDEDVYNRFGDLNWAGGRFRMTILGLPSVPGAGANRVGANSPAGQPGFTGNVAEFLANLAPAAGGDDQQGQRGQSVSIAGQLADLEPAAGGNGGEVSCWSDAMNQAAGGGVVSYSFGGSMEESLSQAASCGGAI